MQIAFCLGIRFTVSPGSLANGINVSFGFWGFFSLQIVSFCVCRKKGDVTPFLLPAASQAARMGGVAGPSIWAPSHKQLSEWDWR